MAAPPGGVSSNAPHAEGPVLFDVVHTHAILSGTSISEKVLLTSHFTTSALASLQNARYAPCAHEAFGVGIPVFPKSRTLPGVQNSFLCVNRTYDSFTFSR